MVQLWAISIFSPEWSLGGFSLCASFLYLLFLPRLGQPSISAELISEAGSTFLNASSQMCEWVAGHRPSLSPQKQNTSKGSGRRRIFGEKNTPKPLPAFRKKKKNTTPNLQTLHLICVCVCTDHLWNKQNSLTVAGHDSACLKYLSQEKYHNWTEQSLTKHLQPSDPGLNL